jgi:hypothetical protein
VNLYVVQVEETKDLNGQAHTYHREEVFNKMCVDEEKRKDLRELKENYSRIIQKMLSVRNKQNHRANRM